MWFGWLTDDVPHRRTVAEIEKDVRKQSQRNSASRLIHAKSDKKKMVAWRRELIRILQIFNVRSVTFLLASLTICLQTELAIDTNAAVSDTHNVVSGTQNIVSDTHSIVSSTHIIASTTHDIASKTHHVASNTHYIASNTHDIVSDIHRAVVKRPEASDGGSLSASSHHPLFVTAIYRCLDSENDCRINIFSFDFVFLSASLSCGRRRAYVTHCER